MDQKKAMKSFKSIKAAVSSVGFGWTINFLYLCWGDLSSRDASKEPQELQEIACYKVEAGNEPQSNAYVESFLLVFLFLLTALYQGIIGKQLLS